MCGQPITPGTTDDAIKLFVPGQKITLKTLNTGCPEVTFTIHKLSIPVTKSVVALAEPDVGDPEEMVIKIFDPRYLDERLAPYRMYPWSFANEQAATVARSENTQLSDQELVEEIFTDYPEDLSGEDLVDHNVLWEERFYRLLMESYDTEYKAYERLKDLQGSAIPRLIMAGQFLPPDERAIQPPALVLEYIPTINLYDIPSAELTPAICAQLLSVIESLPSHGVIHNDLTMTNIPYIHDDK